MTPSQFITFVFASLTSAAASSITLENYFTGDPNGVAYMKMTLTVVDPTTMDMVLQINWANPNTLTHVARGPNAWQETVANLLLGATP